jgi:cytochrome c553
MPLLQRARDLVSWIFASWRRLIATAASLALAALLAGLLFAWSGAYNVAASKDHWFVTELLLRFGMENSVEARAPAERLPQLPDEDAVRLGAGHYQQGCSFCHGAPGVPPSPVAQRMLPAPPDLREKAPLWQDGELFWIVRHGLKYAGMPGWPSQGRDDEVWTTVAFLRRLPELDAEGYARLALGPTGRPTVTLLETCARCHGDQEPPSSLLVPTLQGQPAARLAATLRNYRDGLRDSGIMRTAAAQLSSAEIDRLAAHYAALTPPPRVDAVDREAVARGRSMATQGIAERGVPACLSCHGAGARADYPRLAGQPRRYLAGQLAAWREGLNDRSPTGKIMAPIARLLTAQEAEDLASYFAAQAPSRPLEAAR